MTDQRRTAGLLSLTFWLALCGGWSSIAAADVSCSSPASTPCPIASVQEVGPPAAGVLLAPTSVAVAPDDSVFVTDGTVAFEGQPRLLHYDSVGRFEGTFAPPSSGSAYGPAYGPTSVAVDHSGRVFALGVVGGYVFVFHPDGSLQSSWPIPGADTLLADGGRDRAQMIAAAPDGSAWVLLRSGRLEQFSASGVQLGSPPSKGRKVIPPSGSRSRGRRSPVLSASVENPLTPPATAARSGPAAGARDV